jgi:hypothetical protein
LDECDPNGFGAAAHQCANVIGEVGEEEGIARLKDTSYKRVAEWMSKAWSTDQLKLPVFYRESYNVQLKLPPGRAFGMEAGTTGPLFWWN